MILKHRVPSGNRSDADNAIRLELPFGITGYFLEASVRAAISNANSMSSAANKNGAPGNFSGAWLPMK
jgi:hypothetical protein